MTPSKTNPFDVLSSQPSDKVFYGISNGFRRALTQPSSADEKQNGVDWTDLFQKADEKDIQAFLKQRGTEPEWKKEKTTNEEQCRFDAAIEGLCFATAGLLQRKPTFIAEAISRFALLQLNEDGESTNPANALQRELDGLREWINGVNAGSDFLNEAFDGRPLNPVTSAIVSDLLSHYTRESNDLPVLKTAQTTEKETQNDDVGHCECPLAYAWDSKHASIFRLIVHCRPSDYPTVTPDLFYGGAILWPMARNPGESEKPAGWECIQSVWNHLQPLCPGVRVSLGIEPWDEKQQMPTPILDGDSIQAAVALAIWSAYQQTSLADEAWKDRIKNIDERLLDFELDPTAIVTASLDLNSQSPAQSQLKWVDNVRAKFIAAAGCGLQLGLTAKERPKQNELDGLKLPCDDATTFAELCEKSSLFERHRRLYNESCADEWLTEFLSEEEAEALIAERKEQAAAEAAAAS